MLFVDFLSCAGWLLILCSTVCRGWTFLKDPPKQATLDGIALKVVDKNPGRNLVLAPFAFRFPLCKLATVAKGATKQELMTALGLENDEETKTCFIKLHADIGRLMETDLTLVTRVYVNYTDDIDVRFIQDWENYGVVVSQIGFNYRQAAVQFVNREFDSKTLKRIKDVVNMSDIDGNSSILIVNGIHFKPTWETGFRLQNTKTRTFRDNDNKKSEVPMMNGINQCLHLDDNDERFQAITLHLANHGVSITIIVPYLTIHVDRVLSTLSEDSNFIQKLRKRMRWKQVNVSIPRFKIKTTLDWTDYLKQMGLTLTTSNSSSDLNGILTNDAGYNMYLSKVKQKVFLDVDEMGNHPMGRSRGVFGRPFDEDPLPEYAAKSLPQFEADRPFYFSVTLATENAGILELVSGVYNGPE